MNYIIRNNKERIINSEIMSLSLVKAFLKISNNAQDELLKELLNMSIQYAEWYMEKSLMQQIWQMTCIGMIPKILFIPFGPLMNVSNVVFHSDENLISMKENIDYKIEKSASYIEIFHTPGKGKLEITYNAGYENEQLIPENIKEGILKHVFYVYHQNQNDENMRQIKKTYEQFRELKVVL